ncbi:uncharacterized protein LOC128883913 [Hylaeus volcanicus]|uniref:uncharacterized protein LOC128883913 n=1 Tax=Hylaeus volcanicus TaxID=313075 RepID=UPI0023B7DFC6|nr:uncharacterized protein LOC128883913 [Hylaeus volcanicus]
MKRSSFLGRRRHEDDDELDIFATCADYSNNNIYNSSDRDSSANEDPSTDSDLSDDDILNEINLEENNNQKVCDEKKNAHTQNNSSESQKTSHGAITIVSPDNSSKNIKEVLKLNEGKETDTYYVNSTDERKDTPTENHKINNALPNNAEKSYKTHEKRFRRRMRGRGGFESANGRIWDRETSKDKGFRYPSYFEHEDRLTEVPEDSSTRLNQDHLKKNENMEARKNLTHSANHFSSDRQVSKKKIASQDKWLHDRYEQLLDTTKPTPDLKKKNRRNRSHRNYLSTSTKNMRPVESAKSG